MALTKMLVRMGLAAALIGVAIGYATGNLIPTSRADAMEMAAALVPEHTDALPTGEFDPPFWYGGRYEVRQSFTGGARDGLGLADEMEEELENSGWEIIGRAERPGATVITAIHDDLHVRVQVRHLPVAGPVEGLITVRYLSEPPTLALVVVGGLSSVISFALAAARNSLAASH